MHDLLDTPSSLSSGFQSPFPARPHPARHVRQAAGLAGAAGYLGLMWAISVDSRAPVAVDLAAVLGPQSAGGDVAAVAPLALTGGATPAVAEAATVPATEAPASTAAPAKKTTAKKTTTTAAPETAAPQATTPPETAPAAPQTTVAPVNSHAHSGGS
jgi:hypothetical protein